MFDFIVHFVIQLKKFLFQLFDELGEEIVPSAGLCEVVDYFLLLFLPAVLKSYYVEFPIINTSNLQEGLNFQFWDALTFH